MAYFRGLTSAYFKTASDGQRLYFPWGFWGRGYAIPTEADYQRLRRQMTIVQIVALVLIVVLAGLLGDHLYIAAVIGAGLVALNFVWARFLSAGLAPADERMSVQDSFLSGADAYGAPILWCFEIISLLFVAGGLFLLFTDPSGRLIGLLDAILFGLIAAVIAYMLVLRGRARTMRP